MNEIQRLQDLLHRTYTGTCFHGDAIVKVLEDVDTHQSVWKPEGASHSIWGIVRHMTEWLKVIRARLTSETLVTMPDELNFPAVPHPTLDTWNATQDLLHSAIDALVHALDDFPESKLDAQVPGRDYTFDVLLHGAVHHNLYHLGQISMIKSMYKRVTDAD